MTVNDQLQVDPAQLRIWASAHDAAAEQISAARAEHQQTIAAAQSWGPLFYEARRAAVDAVNARDAALLTEENRHRDMAAQLRTAAAEFERMNQQNVSNLTISTD